MPPDLVPNMFTVQSHPSVVRVVLIISHRLGISVNPAKTDVKICGDPGCLAVARLPHEQMRNALPRSII